MINNFRTHNFEQEVLQSSQPVMVDFWAPWCSHCRALEPALEEFAQDTPNLKIGKVNVDEEPELAKQFRVMTIPTVLLIQNGKVLEKKIAPAEPEEARKNAGIPIKIAPLIRKKLPKAAFFVPNLIPILRKENTDAQFPLNTLRRDLTAHGLCKSSSNG